MELTALERAAARAAGARDRAVRGDGGRWKERGVVHTPPEVARFVARAVDRALVHIGSMHGLADPAVGIVDPACGPGAFLAAALAVGAGRGRAPRRFVGFDVDATAVAHARALIAPAARSARWPLELTCADTLRELDPLGAASTPVAVVMGNPPWAGRTANRDAHELSALLEDFRVDHRGQPLDERKIGVLSDDYVRFFRWAAEIARKAPLGAVVGLVTNASFLDGPVHRGMRASLVEWFDGVEVVDLGGSALIARSRERDDNVFGVRPGVAVTVAWRGPRRRSSARRRPARAAAAVYHVTVRGTREDKLSALAGLDAPDFGRVECVPPRFAFVPTPAFPNVYAQWPSLAELVPFHQEGVQTNRDAIVVDVDRDRLLERLRAFAAGEAREDLALAFAPLPHYDPARARRAVAEALERDPDGRLGHTIRRIAYRPLDTRWFSPVGRLCHRRRPDLLRATRAGGIVLLTTRKDRGQRTWAHFGASREIPDNCWLSTRSSCRTRAFPALTPDGEPNVALDASDRLGATIAKDALLAYALAVITSPRYRHEFDPALRLDYPRIPPAPDEYTFERVEAAGRALIAAFGSERVGVEVEVGHTRVCSDALARAVAGAGDAVDAVLGRWLD